jgi:hypothetical protein
MTVRRTPHLVDVRQIGPKSERDISGRCSACGMVLIARLENCEEAQPARLRQKLDKLFTRHMAETGCGQSPRDSVSKPTGPAHESPD